MNNYKIKAGSTDFSCVIRIIDAADGTPETGVVFNTSGIDLEYRREGAISVDITEATLAALTTAHTDGGFLHIGNGFYRLDLPDAAVAAGSAGVLIHGTVTGMVVIGAYIQLIASDLTELASILSQVGDISNRLPGSLASGRMIADMVSISGDQAAADNLEKEYDGTGYGHILQVTTIATLASQTSFTLTAGSVDNDSYNNCIVVIEDASTAAQKAIGVISDYVGTTKTVTLLNDPVIFTIAVGDIITIIADRALKPTVDTRTLDVTAGGEAGIDFGNIGNPTTVVNLSGITIKTATDIETDTQDIQSKLVTIDGFLDTEIAAILAAVDTEVAAIKAKTDNLPGATIPEPGQGVPPQTPSLEQLFSWFWAGFRNEQTEDGSYTTLKNDVGATLAKYPVSEAGGVFTRGKAESGP